MATALVHDAVDRGQAQTRPVAALLGGEERLEEALFHLGGHALAGVGHGKLEVMSGWQVALGLRDLGLPGGERQGAAGGHGVAGVDDQVEDHLLELAEVHVDRAIGRGELEVQPAVLADEAPQHGLQVADHVVQVEHPRLQRLLAAEGEELAGQGGRALFGLLDLLDVGPPLVALVQPVAEQLALEGDGGQQVVEGVGDAAGQPAHGLHPLGVAQDLLARPQGLLGFLGF